MPYSSCNVYGHRRLVQKNVLTDNAEDKYKSTTAHTEGSQTNGRQAKGRRKRNSQEIWQEEEETGEEEEEEQEMQSIR